MIFHNLPEKGLPEIREENENDREGSAQRAFASDEQQRSPIESPVNNFGRGPSPIIRKFETSSFIQFLVFYRYCRNGCPKVQ